MVRHDDVVVIATYPYLHLAELAASVLEGSGIECFLGDQFVAGIRPEIVFGTGGVKVYVRASDADRAKELLADFETPAEPFEDGEGDD